MSHFSVTPIVLASIEVPGIIEVFFVFWQMTTLDITNEQWIVALLAGIVLFGHSAVATSGWWFLHFFKVFVGLLRILLSDGVYGVYPNMINHQNSEYPFFSIKATSKKRSGIDDKLLMTSSWSILKNWKIVHPAQPICGKLKYYQIKRAETTNQDQLYYFNSRAAEELALLALLAVKFVYCITDWDII